MNILSISEAYRYQFVTIRQFGKVTFWSIFYLSTIPQYNIFLLLKGTFLQQEMNLGSFLPALECLHPSSGG
jgi:hypothetical protein